MSHQTVDVSIFELIKAFSSGIDLFKHKQRRKKIKNTSHDREDEETRLKRSLHRGPVDLQNEYSRNYEMRGERFKYGDSAAIASLATVLLRLNHGLVSFISNFLAGGQRRNVDYSGLTALSEASRLEAIDALSQLSFRLAQSQVRIPPRLPESRSQQDRKKKPLPSSVGKKKPKSIDISKSKISAPVIGMVKLANASAPQLAEVRPRPRPRRMTSGGSNKGPTSPKLPPTSKPQKMPNTERLKAVNKSTPNLGQPVFEIYSSPPPMPAQRVPLQQLPHYNSQQPSQYLPPQELPAYPVHRPMAHGNVPTLEEIQRRRINKMTPSMHTFQSDSTKLGEIPEQNWSTPFNAEEMRRKNLQAAMANSTPIIPVNDRRKGIFGLFKKKNRPVVVG